jgi:hypothetical protein
VALIKDRAQLQPVTTVATTGDASGLDWRNGAQIAVGSHYLTAAIGFRGNVPVSVGLVTPLGQLVELKEGTLPNNVTVVQQAGVSIGILLEFAWYTINKQVELEMEGVEVPKWQELKELLTGDDPDDLWVHANLAAVVATTWFLQPRIIGGPQWIDEIRDLHRRAQECRLAQENSDIMDTLAEMGQLLGNWTDDLPNEVLLDQQGDVILNSVAALLADKALQIVDEVPE